MRRALGGALAVLLLAGCSQPIDAPATAPSAPTTPQIQVSDEASAPATDADFTGAVDFVTALYQERYDEIGQYVADNSVAARYVRHQTATHEVDSNNGNIDSIDPADVDVTPDDEAGSVKVEDRTSDPVGRYTWQDFTYSGGKITGWQVKGRPDLDARLWHAKASDSGKGVKANLISAYQGNAGGLTVVVEIASEDKDIRVFDAFYTPKGGYRHADAADLDNEVDEGGKTLTYLNFAKSDLDGTLRLEIGDDDGYDLTALELEIK